jgi:hypothetical protein
MQKFPATIAIDIDELSPFPCGVARHAEMPQRSPFQIGDQCQAVRTVVNDNRLAVGVQLRHGRKRVRGPMPGERVRKNHGANQVFVLPDVDDAVEVFRTDEPVIGAVAVIIQNGAREMGDESDRGFSIRAVVSTDPELLSRLTIIGRDLKEPLVIRALTRHTQQDPPAASRAQSAGRTAIESRHAGQHFNPEFFFSGSIQNDTNRLPLMVSNRRYHFVFAIAVHVADQWPSPIAR